MKNRSQYAGVIGLSLVALGLSAALFWTILHRQRDMGAALALARRDYPNVPRIQVSDLQAQLNDRTRPQPQLFDVRTAEEYAVSCIPGARRVEPNARVKTVREMMDRTRPAVFYCSLGYRSSALVSAMQDAGITNNIFNLEGSIFAWANAGLPLETPATHQPATKVHPFSASYARLLKPGLAAPIRVAESARNEIAVRQRVRMFFAFGLLVFFLAWETLWPMYAWFKSRARERFEHGFRNVVLGLLNTVIVAAFFVQAWLWATNYAQDHRLGLLNWLNPPAWARYIIALLLLDGWMYSWHRLNHGIPFLWRFHRVHHSERYLDVTSSTRFHLGEITLSALIRIPLIFIFGVRFPEIVIYETLLFAIVQFHHANIRLPEAVERIVSQIIVTPNIHRVHHSRVRIETDSNFSSLLSFWDRAFRTRRQTDLDQVQMGLDEYSTEETQTLKGMLKTPLVKS
jgi:sterol desaturase/sphingolipid hydroxylase (fatty acid hydroxylase superfamily)/rhodanese-related sulfurtransferase